MLPAIIEAAPPVDMLHLATESALALLTLSGIAFSLIALKSARSFLRESEPKLDSSSAPPVSILKPLKGADRETYSALRSHCLQQYGRYEILFAVNDAQDEAVELVERLMAEFPNRDIRLVVCDQVFGSNRKVSNLIHLLRQAKYPSILVNDGDIRVAPGYLQAVTALFKDSKVGMVTCLYRGRAGKTLGSRLEALSIATDFAPGVLTARWLDRGLSFGLGSTLAMSRSALDQSGGFDAVVDYLADDYQLGKRMVDAGFKVALSREVVETSIPPYSFSRFWEHQLRWARTMRISRPLGYAGVVVTFSLAWAMLFTLAEPARWWSWTLLLTALFARLAVALSVGLGTLCDRQLPQNLWLLPLRDLLAMAIWFSSYLSNTVTWGGEKFRLEDGRMYPLSNGPSPGEVNSNQKVHSEIQR